MTIRFILVLTLLLTMATWAQESAVQGKQLFQVHCQVCHGVQGKGDGPASVSLKPVPRDLTQRPYKYGCGPGAVVNTLRTGIEGTAMPSFSKTLSEEELWALGSYVRSLQSSCCSQ